MNMPSDVLFARKNELERTLSEILVKLPVSIGSSGLACELSKIVPELAFRDVLTRGGWYRLGGVVDSAGKHVADDIATWGETELARHGDDIHSLYDAYAWRGLKATRMTGRTHYLVAVTGPQASDFIQVEIEELQEIVSHELFSDSEPGSLEELYEPPRVEEFANSDKAGQSVGMPFFTLRRVIDVADFLRRMAGQKPELQGVQRFFDAWQSSSAGNVTHFSNHWIVAVREYLDHYRQSILQATPVAALNGLPSKFVSAYGARGLALNEALQRFDRQSGYPMAWFFHMLTTKSVPYAVAHAVIDDVQGGFSYLPERDVKVIKDWMHLPFGF